MKCPEPNPRATKKKPAQPLPLLRFYSSSILCPGLLFISVSFVTISRFVIRRVFRHDSHQKSIEKESKAHNTLPIALLTSIKDRPNDEDLYCIDELASRFGMVDIDHEA